MSKSKMSKSKREMYKSQISESVCLMLDEATNKVEVMCAFLRAVDAMSQLFISIRNDEAERALLWVIHEQCEYAGKAYAKLLIHGEDAFKALGLEDGCDIKEIERRLFEED